MALPSLTPAEKKKALEKAQTMRRARAELRAKLKKGNVKFADLISGRKDPVVQRMKVSYLLKSLPRVGKVKAEKIMEEVGIDESAECRVSGETERGLAGEFLEKNREVLLGIRMSRSVSGISFGRPHCCHVSPETHRSGGLFPRPATEGCSSTPLMAGALAR